MALAKYVFLIPLTYNDGRRVPTSVLDHCLAALFDLAGGYTLAGTVSGAYRMHSGLKQVDQCSEIWVVLDRSQERHLKRWLADMASELGQESIYFERSSATISFIKPRRVTGVPHDDESGTDPRGRQAGSQGE
jgi:hypothetical protein